MLYYTQFVSCVDPCSQNPLTNKLHPFIKKTYVLIPDSPLVELYDSLTVTSHEILTSTSHFLLHSLTSKCNKNTLLFLTQMLHKNI